MTRRASAPPPRPEITPQTVRRMAILTDEIADALDAALAATIAPHRREPHLDAAIVGGLAMAITRLEKDGMTTLGDNVARVVRINRPPQMRANQCRG